MAYYLLVSDQLYARLFYNKIAKKVWIGEIVFMDALAVQTNAQGLPSAHIWEDAYKKIQAEDSRGLGKATREQVEALKNKVDLADRTLDSYIRHWLSFIRWYKREIGEEGFLPTSQETLETYFTTLMHSDYSMALITCGQSAISFFNKYHTGKDPTGSADFRSLMKKIRKYRKGDVENQKLPLTRAIILDCISENKKVTMRGTWKNEFESPLAKERRIKRDTCMLWFMLTTGCRRSEVANAEWTHISEVPDSNEGQLLIPYSKTDQMGEGQYVPLPEVTMKYLKEWADVAPRNRRNSHKVFGVGSAKLLIANFKRLLKQAGYDHNLYSGHSGRVGLAWAMAGGNATDQEIMSVGRWKSYKSLSRYLRKYRVTSTTKYFSEL